MTEIVAFVKCSKLELKFLLLMILLMSFIRFLLRFFCSWNRFFPSFYYEFYFSTSMWYKHDSRIKMFFLFYWISLCIIHRTPYARKFLFVLLACMNANKALLQSLQNNCDFFFVFLFRKSLNLYSTWRMAQFLLLFILNRKHKFVGRLSPE